MPPKTLVATLYRLTGIEPTADAMFEATFTGRLTAPGVDVEQHDIAGAPAILYSRTHPATTVGWGSALSQLTGVPMHLPRQDSEAVLVVAVDGHVYGLGFGQGYLSLMDAREPGFGRRCALRLVDPRRVRDVVRRPLGGITRQDATLVPGGIPIGGIGLREHADLVKKLGGLIDAADLGLSHRDQVSVEGADGLRLPVPLDPVRFLALLRRLNEISERDVPPEFESLEAIQAVTDRALHDALDALFNDGLRGGDLSLQLVVPADYADRRHETRSYLVKVGSVTLTRAELDLDDLRQRCKVQYCVSPVTALRDGWVEMRGGHDGTEVVGRASAIRWIEAVVPMGSHVYQLSDGDWYECGAGYASSIARRLRDLVPAVPEPAMPPWRHGEKEEDYNLRLQDHFGIDRYVCLDQKFIRTSQHRRGRGFEACDGFTAEGTLIHVKAAEGSGPLSHQLNQALISIQALFYQAEARLKFAAMVAEFSGGRITVPEDFRPRKVVLAMLLKGKELTADSLYPFTQAALVTMADTLMRDHGVTVEVVGIPAEGMIGEEAA
ncbi:DUF6119 family protein [Sphaerisporangium sp. B11E5]|uniref:DUF6119 family protein n=1 Tax=Sphaerisporangium sp. B11E5 TaxID=3153563 RepID=UPI00325F794B